MMRSIAVIMLLCMGPLMTAFSAEPPDLRRNPFVSPLNQDADGSSGADATPASGEELKLKGVLTSGDVPLVNFGGRIMAPGDEIGGYLLLSVGEGQAVFDRNGQSITMSLYSEQED